MRGFFNDPRVQDASHAFHFGIDVSAPDGTAVYAVTPGKVFIEDKGHAVAVQAPNGRAFGYWHVKPAVAHHQQVGLHQLLGHIEARLGPRPFRREPQGPYLDPIRPGALQPFVDVGHPTIAKIMFRRGKKEPRPPHQGPHADLLRRLRHDAGARAGAVVAHAGRARAAAVPHVVRRALRAAAPPGRRPPRVPQARPYTTSTAADTRQNHPASPVATCFILAHDWNSRAFPNNRYNLEVQAADIHGNRVSSMLPFAIRN